MAAYHADVGRRIREARQRNRPGLSQEDAGHELGVTAKTVGRWERGESLPRGKQWEPLATMLGVAVEELRGADPSLPEDELREQLHRIQEELAEVHALLAEFTNAWATQALPTLDALRAEASDRKQPSRATPRAGRAKGRRAQP